MNSFVLTPRAQDDLNDIWNYIANDNINVVFAMSFRTQIGTKFTNYRAGKNKVGYYLIAPNRKPRIEDTGIMDDDLLLEIAHDYFGPGLHPPK